MCLLLLINSGCLVKLRFGVIKRGLGVVVLTHPVGCISLSRPVRCCCAYSARRVGTTVPKTTPTTTCLRRSCKCTRGKLSSYARTLLPMNYRSLCINYGVPLPFRINRISLSFTCQPPLSRIDCLPFLPLTWTILLTFICQLSLSFSFSADSSPMCCVLFFVLHLPTVALSYFFSSTSFPTHYALSVVGWMRPSRSCPRSSRRSMPPLGGRAHAWPFP